MAALNEIESEKAAQLSMLEQLIQNMGKTRPIRVSQRQTQV